MDRSHKADMQRKSYRSGHHLNFINLSQLCPHHPFTSLRAGKNAVSVKPENKTSVPEPYACADISIEKY
jgi:hypothetical protein